MQQEILKANKYRLYPTVEQEQSLNQQAGNCRFLWNLFLSINKQHHENTGKWLWKNDLIKLLPQLKKEHQFLSLTFSQSLQQVGINFHRALKDYFNPKLDR